MKIPLFFILAINLLVCIVSCKSQEIDENEEESTSPNILSTTDQASITKVVCLGQPGNYTFQVTISSPDTGCDQYADWWEVFTPDSTLIYRRILAHSHVNEQPFTRSGGPVNVGADEFIYVRAHMNNTGYGTLVFSGTVRQELEADTLDISYAARLETEDPLPGNCDF